MRSSETMSGPPHSPGPEISPSGLKTAKLAGAGRRGGLEPRLVGSLDVAEFRRTRVRQRDRLRGRAAADHDTDCHHRQSELHVPCIREYRGVFKITRALIVAERAANSSLASYKAVSYMCPP
jgi:hypothetical protein